MRSHGSPEGRHRRRAGLAVAALLLGQACGGALDEPSPSGRLRVPVEYYVLDNGLRVVLSQDSTLPTVAVAVYYGIGFRSEPAGRTGFAHLFEHMMFQGSGNLPKGAFDQLAEGNGGLTNGSTRFDYTNYFEVVPSHVLEPMLWAEADRMSSLAVTEENLRNQKDVVKNEVRVAVLNRPYGGFPWLDLPQAAFDNFHNGHNFYGDLDDLEAATLEEVQAFFRDYYAPSNAVLAVVGDFAPRQAMGWVRRYFEAIPSAPPAARPDVSEPPQEAERRGSRVDRFATRPAFATAYRMPERGSEAYWAMGLIDQILLQGEDSWLYESLVVERGFTGELSGGINWPLGDMFNYDGPMLWSLSLVHDAEVGEEQILGEIDRAVARLQEEPLPREVLDRALVKLRSALYDRVEEFSGVGRADLLAVLALFDGDPAAINDIEDRFREVTPEVLQRTAREVLVPGARTSFVLQVSGEGETP